MILPKRFHWLPKSFKSFCDTKSHLHPFLGLEMNTALIRALHRQTKGRPRPGPDSVASRDPLNQTNPANQHESNGPVWAVHFFSAPALLLLLQFWPNSSRFRRTNEKSIALSNWLTVISHHKEFGHTHNYVRRFMYQEHNTSRELRTHPPTQELHGEKINTNRA